LSHNKQTFRVIFIENVTSVTIMTAFA